MNKVEKSILHNPIMWSDVPDVDTIRVGDAFYMVSTSMHTMPGCPIMKSVDLVNWEIVSYIFDILEDNDGHNLLDGVGIYGQGSWACSLRYHNNMFYACFACNDMKKTYIYRTDDIEHGKWERDVFEGVYHDPSLLFDDEKVYIIYGNGTIRIIELTEDARAIKPNGLDQMLLETAQDGIGLRCEGCHAYKINGMYYLFFIEWPIVGKKRRRQVCYRSETLFGEYECKIVMDDDLGYHNNGVAQGGIFDTLDGDWYAMLFQDHDAVGRMPCILPLKWENGWPILGVNGKVPAQMEIQFKASQEFPLVISDEFEHDHNKLKLNWQWNHNPDNKLWSFTARPGYLRLKTGNLATNILNARNTLTQRTEGPFCSGSTLIELSNMIVGDYAGLVALQNTYGTVGVKISSNGNKYVIMSVNGGEGDPEEMEQIELSIDRVFFKIEFDFEDSRDVAEFYYSLDGAKWIKIGGDLAMKYTLDHFMGYRIGLFNYATQQIGGFADFEYFHYSRT